MDVREAVILWTPKADTEKQQRGTLIKPQNLKPEAVICAQGNLLLQ